LNISKVTCRRVLTVAAIAGTIGLFGLSTADASVTALPTQGASASTVHSGGIYSDAACDQQVQWYAAHQPNITAWCQWHPPIQFGYKELYLDY
jgi:hypothetical protein